MLNQTYSANITGGLLEEWDTVSKCKKPIIAAVNGYAVNMYFKYLIDTLKLLSNL